MLTAYSPGSGLDKIRSLRFSVTEHKRGHCCTANDEATDDFHCVSALLCQAVIKRSALTAQLIALFSRESDCTYKHQPVLLPNAPARGQSFKGRNTPSNQHEPQSFSFARFEFPVHPWHPPAPSSEYAGRASILQLSSRFCGLRIRALRPD